jgi:hypothetical protein
MWSFVNQPDGGKRYASAQALNINQMLKGTIPAQAADVDGNAATTRGVPNLKSPLFSSWEFCAVCNSFKVTAKNLTESECSDVPHEL